MFETTEKISNLLYKLGKLRDLSMYGEAEDIVTKNLITEINLTAEKWENEIRKKFDKWFIKHANLSVLYRKKEEILKSE